MIASISCCLNLCPPPGPSSLPTKRTKIANRQKEEISWRNRSLLGVACVVIGIQMENTTNLGDLVLAEELQAGINIIELKNEKTRWSDKRSCAPWRLNSLETIVPENLPRPTARRRWEAVGFAGATAPAVKAGLALNTSNGGCFSM